MKWNVRRAAVLGAGTMGSRIAAHLANCGIPVFLLDLAPQELTVEEKQKGLTLSSPQVRNRIAMTGLDVAKKSKPPAFFLEETASFVTPGNFEDHLSWVSEADWIIEAVMENLEVKRRLLERVVPLRRPGTVVSTNTSGLSIKGIVDGFPEEFRQHWLGAHFFNPPRYLHLLEVVPGPDTLPEVVEAVSTFADQRLGKGVVRAKDTPNFVGNRIGIFSLLNILRAAQEEGLTVEDVDQLTGALIGCPNSATFGTVDLIGLDVMGLVTRTIFDNAPQDESQEMFRLPEFAETMLARGLLGPKTGSGFYKRPKAGAKGEIQAIDLQTLEYRPQKKSDFPSVAAARKIENTGERVRTLFQSDDAAGRFLWKALTPTFVYAARRIPEIADRILEIDRAMKWGFGWELGPFELWDAVGVSESVRRLEREGVKVPENVRKMLSSGNTQFYQGKQGARYFDFRCGNYQPVEQAPGILLLHGGQQEPRVVRQDPGVSLLDIGDGVACVEFCTKANAIGPEIIEMMNAGLQELTNGFDALVIANQGANFSSGENLQLLLTAIKAGHWDQIDLVLRSSQQLTLAMKYSTKPVVAAPFKQALGAACEMALAAPRIQAGAETYMGLNEATIGLVPAGGGTKEMLLRVVDRLPTGADLLPAIKEVYQTINQSKISANAEDARRLRYLRPSDGVTMNPERLVADAKQAALEMISEGDRPAYPGPRSDIRAAGEGDLAEIKMSIYIATQGKFMSEHDGLVASKIAHILCGGKLSGPTLVKEQYLLDLEREAFLSLCGEAKTQARIEQMVATGKPLMN